MNKILLETGVDLSSILKIQKYEIQLPAQLSGVVKGSFPSFMRRSDENRLQSLRSSIYDEFHGKECYVSLKYDGTSSTYYKYNDKVGVCSRNLELKEPEEGQSLPVYWETEKRYDILNKLKKLDTNYQIISENYGMGIQKNPLGISGHDLAVFTLFNIDKQEYCGYQELKNICEKLELPMVKVLDVFTYDKNIHTLDYWLKFAEGYYEGTKNEREGLVIRSCVPFYSETLHGLSSFKVINNKFLLKEE